MNKSHGFSLVEMAMVVAIALILLSLGLTAINSQLTSAHYAITKKRQEAIKDALIAYLGARKSFPCPYVPTAGTPATGTAPLLAGPVPACASFGTVPYAALGLAREAVEDGWGNLFSYQVYGIPANCPGTNSVNWMDPACFGSGKSGVLIINDGSVAAPITLAGNAIVVLVSHGANGLGAWVAAQGTRNAFPVTCVEAHNAQYTGLAGCTIAPATFYKGETQENDDVVTYLTANDVIPALAKQGTIPSPVAQVNSDLQTLYEQAIAGNTTTAIGNCANAPAALTSSRDPWGALYANLIRTGSVMFCFYSRGGIGASMGALPDSSCNCNPPTICKLVDKSTLDTYRNRLGNLPCA